MNQNAKEKMAAERIAELERHLSAALAEVERWRSLASLDGQDIESALKKTGFRSLAELQDYAERCFADAHYILGDEDRSFAAAGRALRKIAVEKKEVSRRKSYLQRKKASPRGTKALLEIPQLAQLHLWLETTAEELEQEKTLSRIHSEDLLIRAVKQLVEAGLDLRVCYLNAALSCLLRGFSIKESWRVQKLLDRGETEEWPKEFAGDPAKRSLRDSRAKIRTAYSLRFDRFLEPPEDSWRRVSEAEVGRLGPLIEDTLKVLSLWDVADPWPKKAASAASLSFLGPKQDPLDLAEAELQRKATLIHPRRYRRLLALLEMSDLSTRWHVPPFIRSFDDSSSAPPMGGHGPEGGLGQERLLELIAQLAQDADARAELPPVVHLSLDGRRVARWHHREEKQLSLPVEATHRRLELSIGGDQEEVPLATIWLQGLEPGRELERTIGPGLELRVVLSEVDPEEGMRVLLRTGKAKRSGLLSGAFLLSPAWRWAAATLVLSALTFLFGQLLSNRPPEPVAGVAFTLLDPQWANPRSGDEPQEILVARHASRLVLVVAVPEVASAKVYQLELFAGDVLMASWPELRPIEGELSLSVPVEGLAEGIYEMRLRETADGAAPERVKFEVRFDAN